MRYKLLAKTKRILKDKRERKKKLNYRLDNKVNWRRGKREVPVVRIEGKNINDRAKNMFFGETRGG